MRTPFARRGGVWRCRQAAAYLAICGLACQLVLTAFAIPAAFAAVRSEPLPPGYTAIVICSGAGMKRIVIDADGNPVDQEQHDTVPRQCTACHVVAGCVLEQTSGPGVAAPLYRLERHATPVAQIQVSQRQFLRPEGRAPPDFP
jgi:hypothetical protein